MARSLLLDLDGTLVDTVPDLAAALNRLMRSHGLPPFSRVEVAGMVGDGVAVLVTRAFAAHGRPVDPNAVAAFSADYEAHIADESTLYPNVIETLDRLSAEGWRLAVCTNKPERAACALLGAVGLLPMMCAVGGGDSFAVRKPDPGHVLATLSLAGGTPAQALLLGDHRNDVLAATGAGIQCIFAGWGYGAPAMGAHSAAVAPNIRGAARIADQLLPGT